jgi:outer membrane protein
MKKYLLLSLVSWAFATPSLSAEDGAIGVVNFNTCILESKVGRKEQENVEGIRSQMTHLIEETEKEIKELSAKFEDTEFLDSLSPKAEEELKLKYQTLQEDMGRYQNQFYQVLQHAQMQLYQKMHGTIAKAAETLAKQKKIDYVLNKDTCFYIRSDLDMTSFVIGEMDKTFEAEAKKLSENSEIPSPAKNGESPTAAEELKAGA